MEALYKGILKEMVQHWRNDPQWATAHSIYKDMLRKLHLTHMANIQCDECVSRQLAWQVFFQRFVMSCADRMEAKNGSID